MEKKMENATRTVSRIQLSSYLIFIFLFLTLFFCKAEETDDVKFWENVIRPYLVELERYDFNFYRQQKVLLEKIDKTCYNTVITEYNYEGQRGFYIFGIFIFFEKPDWFRLKYGDDNCTVYADFYHVDALSTPSKLHFSSIAYKATIEKIDKKIMFYFYESPGRYELKKPITKKFTVEQAVEAIDDGIMGECNKYLFSLKFRS